jgi:aspartyl-tRNA(Asn)/glutamyl-tRNA(Gln) amidotransferase subunit B
MNQHTQNNPWEVVIGMETHVQLKTKSKMFSSASTAFGSEPNTQASYVDLALPGTLPVVNQEAIRLAIKFGLAIQAEIDMHSVFARKNYFYPDLPKGYQISQLASPIVGQGNLSINIDDIQNPQKQVTKNIRITRAHLEEDAGKSVHDLFSHDTGVDLNRAGTPLLEIVTEPDLRSAQEAVAYAKALHTLVTWIDICDGNMQEGSFRCDANVSVRRKNDEKLGTRCEIKNLNSFRFLQEAIEYEVQRQIEILEDGGSIRQETRLYDSTKKETRSMRSKEDAQDYRYFSDPDLLPIALTQDMLEKESAALPELPEKMRYRLIHTHDLSEYDSTFVVQSRAMANYFDQCISEAKTINDKGIQAKTLVNWLMGDMSNALNQANLSIEACPISAKTLVKLIQRIEDSTINQKTAKDIFDLLWHNSSQSVDEIIETKGLKQMSDSSAILNIIKEVLANNAKMIEEYKAGKEKAFNALVGQIMKASKGKANPAQVNALLKQQLDISCIS